MPDRQSTATASPASDLETGRWIWPFQILERIGEGGMGQVYRAQYVPRKIDVALKMVPAEVTDPTTLARFEREMEVLKDLKHPHIVRTFGGVSEDKQRFYAMELMPAGTLEDELQERGKLSWEKVVEYGGQMCAALDYLHSKGVVHRDVKPSNFLKTNDGRIKLSDFGLASVVAARKITAEGRTAGTFLYMAPEQIRGGNVLPQTDLYALGCVLFELLTGRPPLVGETPAATLHKHCQTIPPRVTEYALDCPASLDRIVSKLLQKKPEDRYGSAAEVARDLALVTQAIEVSSSRQQDNRARVGNELVRERPGANDQETRTEAVQVPLGHQVPRWRLYVELGGGVLLLAMLAWVASLRSTLSHAERAETLWVQALRQGEAPVRIAAALALGEIGTEEALMPLAKTLADKSVDASVRAAAAKGLGNAGDPARLHPRLDQDPEGRRK
ncbi:MAG: protein kinase [Planctomycetaceae bacterium]